MVTVKHIIALSGLIAVLGCTALTGVGDLGGNFEPVWITASWTGGAAGPPNDRTNREPAEFQGQLCPASSVILTNQSAGAVLNVINNCTIPMTLAICVTAGGLIQPDLGLDDCAVDPFDTSLFNFKLITLNPGNVGDFVNSTPALSVQIFYCSDETQFVTGPVGCLGF